MTAHTSRSFLHSCLKVPIDPCNNCPAPIYNRPKMYLGRLTTTPMSSTVKHTTTTGLKTSEVEENSAWGATSTGIRSLAKLYDSIPDYRDINHLPNEEFYSTLDTLRSTCCQLKTKPINTCVLDETSTTSSISSRCSVLLCGKPKKHSKKKSTSAKSGSKKKSSHKLKYHDHKLEMHMAIETPCSMDYKLDVLKRSRLKSFKDDFEDEVEAFKRSLKDLEEELKQRPHSAAACREKLDHNKRGTNNRCEDSHTEKIESSSPKPAVYSPREYLKKSYSFNDLTSISDSKDSTEIIKYKHRNKLSKTELLLFRDGAKMSNYFASKNKKHEISSITPDGLPKIIVETVSSENQSSKGSGRSIGGRKKKLKSKKYDGQFQVPFSLFNLGNSRKENVKHTTPSPVHPVARPNLAATLRAEVSKKKLQELQNNCTYSDSTPQFDWEVRKTPAWKSLSLNESHKEILSLRLATRKAEQALQQREYQLNMELMRQRVKSAPLLLEGPTHWGPHVGKLTHSCQDQGIQHLCQTNQRRQRKKSTCNSATRDGARSGCSQRLDSMRKIYASSAKTHSRNSQGKHNEESRGQLRTSRPVETLNVDNDSGEELSSLDRAYL